jgi:hypothetical protein
MLDRARQLRREMTLPERLLWREIRGRRLGPRFRRQVPMEPYVVDFYCPQARLIVEVDGECHAERQVADARRTSRLESRRPRWRAGAAADRDPPLRPWRATSPARGNGVDLSRQRAWSWQQDDGCGVEGDGCGWSPSGVAFRWVLCDARITALLAEVLGVGGPLGQGCDRPA